MFHKDTNTRTDARNTFLKHINDAICANYGSDLHITHKCVDKNENEILKSGIANNIFKDKDPRYFRQGRHQDYAMMFKEELCTVVNATKQYQQLIL